jgi:dimethylargininase
MSQGRTFTHAIVRPPSPNFFTGHTTADLGKPHYSTALKQHVAYCEVLEKCGLTLTILPPDALYPDSTFVEDAAILTKRCAIITRPGAASRRGEVTTIERELANFFDGIERIEAPGTVDGGDICEAGDHFFIGISQRTNEVGARQLAELLAKYDYTSEFVDVRNVKGILHLKSGIAYLREGRFVLIDELERFPQFRQFNSISVGRGEEYAANCVMVNDSLLIAAGFPDIEHELNELGFTTMSLQMSEFQKMDGGLSCLSLRFNAEGPALPKA